MWRGLPIPSGSVRPQSPPPSFSGFAHARCGVCMGKDPARWPAPSIPGRGQQSFCAARIQRGVDVHLRLHSKSRGCRRPRNRSAHARRFARPFPLNCRTGFANTGAIFGFRCQSAARGARPYGDFGNFCSGRWGAGCRWTCVSARTKPVLKDHQRQGPVAGDAVAAPNLVRLLVHVPANSPKVPANQAVGLFAVGP